jgi:Tfp pilus assembly protein PilZ
MAEPPPIQGAAAAAAGNGPNARVDAELGAHSPSNFYKGLAGNDVVEHGGIFIATYKIPRVGQTLIVHVSMPGGYEFDAAAVVRWTRETVDSSSQGHSAPPGFGAQFTQIAPEARQLIYRYVRNREPLFHDDL